MASIQNNPLANGSGNAQLAGIVSSVPMPTTGVPVMANGTPVMYSPTGTRLDVGGSQQPAFTVEPTITNGQSLVGGGGIATGPADGAQPANPLTAAPATTAPATGSAATNAAAAAASNIAAPAVAGSTSAATSAATGAASVAASSAEPAYAASGAGADAGSGSVVMTVSGNAGTNHVQAPANGVAASAGDGAPVATAVSVSGFGNADRKSTMVAKLGNGSTFSFPSFNSTRKSSAAPAITWGAGWSKVDKGDGFFYMQDANGNKAVPAVEWRLTPSPLSAAKTVKMAHGWGKKLPDGTVIVFDKTQGPYYLDPKGAKHKLKPGMHTFGKVKVRIFEVSVVRVLEPSGAVSVFDSRGNHGAGTPRLTQPDAGPSSAAGGGKMSEGGGLNSVPATDPGALTTQINKITDVARGLLQQVQGGKIDTAALQALQSQLSTLPDGIRQAIGGAGVTTGDAAALGLASTGGGATTDAGPTSDTGAVASADAGPVAGASTPDATEQLGPGATVQLDVAKSQAGTRRFAQLPEDLQESIAAAFGSELGTAAFEPDTQFTITAGGEVSLASGATLYKHPQAHVTGGGPGDDLAMTLKPVRQTPWSGGGWSDDDGATGGGASSSTPTAAPDKAHIAGQSSGSGGDSATRKAIFSAGDKATIPALAADKAGSYTWASLPADARSAIEEYLKTATSTAAGSAWASRTGDGWDWDPSAPVVLSGGTVTFPQGLVITRSGAAAAADPAAQAAATPTPDPAPASSSSAAPAPSSTATHSSSHAAAPPAGSGSGTGEASAAVPPVPNVNMDAMHQAGVDMSQLMQNM